MKTVDEQKVLDLLPPMPTAEFIESLRQEFERGLELVAKKNADYSGPAGALNNFLYAERLGIASAEAALLVRMSDKISRLATLSKQSAQVVDEKIEDTTTDLMNYAAIFNVLRKYRLSVDNSLKDKIR